MSQMVCGSCGRTGIAWVGPLDNPEGTRCPHCGGENCQRIAPIDRSELDEGSPCPEGCGGELAFVPEGECSCHVSAPCGACVDAPLTCLSCGWGAE